MSVDKHRAKPRFIHLRTECMHRAIDAVEQLKGSGPLTSDLRIAAKAGQGINHRLRRAVKYGVLIYIQWQY